ncbi:MAG: esterase [Lachnospiraceae bacterium]|nr:esterase [Lachnospiraceae bacterium]MBQ8667821.1 esterase [Lachnospiraceae bacterium]
MEIINFGQAGSANVLIQPVDDHDLSYIEKETDLIKEAAGDDWCLIAVKVGNWNRDLSPWSAPAVFGNDDFRGHAGDTLQEILKLTGDAKKTYYIGGYSLAGLFSLWAAYNTDIFAGVAAASPSVWFPEFTSYMESNRIGCNSVYLSLGDKEEKTKNHVMSTVGDCIRSAYELLSKEGIDCILEWNSGNHFKDADIRTAKAFAWILNHSLNRR